MSGAGRTTLLVSIINFRTADLTIACVASVLEDIRGLAAEVVVVDNASGDGSAEAIEAWIAAHPGAPVRLIRSPVNTGFSGGHNIGIGAGPADFYLVLNSDAVLRPGFSAAILQAAAQMPRVGLFAARLEDEDGTRQDSCFRVHGIGSEIIRSARTGAVARLLRRFDVTLPMPPDPDQIGWASFACILLRGEMVAQLGPMDEGFFLYFEDVEYCLRARRAGWAIRYVEAARAVHFRGGSAPVKSLAAKRKRLPAYFYASRTRLLYLAHGRAGLLLANLGFYLGRAIARARVLAGGKPRPPTEGEARDIWINFLTPLGDRRAPE